MRVGSRGVGSPYEVRCPRCDVTFPVETRTCVHCGGPTSSSNAHPIHGSEMPPIEIDTGGYRTTVPAYDEADRARTGAEHSPSTWSGAGGSGRGSAVGGGVGDAHGEAEPPSIVRSILNSLGALVWIVLLVVFSLVRECGQ